MHMFSQLPACQSYLRQGKFMLFLLVVDEHDVIVGMVFVSMVTLIKDQQGKLANGLDHFVSQCIQKYLRCHDEDVLVLYQARHRGLAAG